MYIPTFVVVAGFSLTLIACGGGSSDPQSIAPPFEDPALSPTTASATYRVTAENYWGVDDFPQGYPDNAHLSWWGGGTHNSAVSFWALGDVASRGIEDMAETGLIDILLADEIGAAIALGTADSTIEHRIWTPPPNGTVPGTQTFDIQVNQNYPLVTLVSMLGPSPDWFVGVSGLSLQDENGWLGSLVADLALHDGGSKSDITPVMGGPDIIPPDPISLIAYEVASGTYRPTEVPQSVAVLRFDRVN